MRFNNYLISKFAGCVLLHEGVDPHRNRPAKYYALPGEFAVIGYSDDVDTFIIPAAGNGFLPDGARKALAALQSGETFTVQRPQQAPTRARGTFAVLVESPTPQPPVRRPRGTFQ